MGECTLLNEKGPSRTRAFSYLENASPGSAEFILGLT
jgi:hypothetical protein